MLAITACAVLLAMLEVTKCGNEEGTATDGTRSGEPPFYARMTRVALVVKRGTRKIDLI